MMLINVKMQKKKKKTVGILTPLCVKYCVLNLFEHKKSFTKEGSGILATIRIRIGAQSDLSFDWAYKLYTTGLSASYSKV